MSPSHPEITLGRDPSCDIIINSGQVSRVHARLTPDGDRWLIEDLGSTNGTFVNGQKVIRKHVQAGDDVRLGSCQVDIARALRRPVATNGGARLDCLNLCRTVSSPAGPKTLLENVTFSLLPGEVMAIVGPSGAGKTTLLHALCGYAQADSGHVLVDGEALYGPRAEDIRAQIGLVPQDDLVHQNILLSDALQYAAQLRLPPATTASFFSDLVGRTAAEVGLTPHLGKRVRTLSGGERKRASVAVELLSRPRLIFFDEPTTGLDPGLERQFMELARNLAQSGHTVVIITHSTRSLHECDIVLVMAPGGRAAYVGPPEELQAFFGVSDDADIYDCVTGRRGSADWPSRFRMSPAYARYVAERLARPAVESSLVAGAGRVGAFRQFQVLVARYLSSLLGDSLNFLILILQAPIIGLILATIFPSTCFDATATKITLKHSQALMCMLVVSAVWFGLLNSAREVVKELPIFRRERMVGLNPLSYLLSKSVPLTVLSILQCAVLLVITGLKVDMYGIRDGSVLALMLLYLGLTSVCGVHIGLCLSSLANSSDQAISFTPIIMIPQVVFCGIFTAIDEGGPALKAAARLFPTNWSFAGLGNILDLNAKFGSVPITQPLVRSTFDITPPEVITALLLMAAVFFGLSVALIYRDRGTGR